MIFVTTPAVVIFPIHPPTNQSLPSGPAVIANGPELSPEYSVTIPEVVIFPIDPIDTPVNQRSPSGPGVIPKPSLPMGTEYSAATQGRAQGVVVGGAVAGACIAPEPPPHADTATDTTNAIPAAMIEGASCSFSSGFRMIMSSQ